MGALYRITDTDGTADLQRKIHEATTEMIKSKMDNFFRQIEGLPEDEEPVKTQKVMDAIIEALDSKESEEGSTPSQITSAITLIETLFSTIMQFSYKYRKKHQKNNPMEIINLKQDHINKLKMQGKTIHNSPEIAAAQERINEERQNINIGNASRRLVDLNMNEDKPTKSFLSRGKNGQTKTRITKINKDGKTLIGDDA